MKSLLKKLSVTLTLVLVMLGFQGTAFAYANSVEGATQFVNEVSGKVMGIAASGKDDKEKESILNNIFFETLDADWIGKFALGKYWTELNDEQKINYLRSYRNYLSASYVPLFKKYNGQKILIKEIKNLGNDTFVAVTEINQAASAASVKVEYRLKYTNNSFKVRDIIAEGVSLLNTQRSDFSSIVNNGGFDALIKKLSDKS